MILAEAHSRWGIGSKLTYMGLMLLSLYVKFGVVQLQEFQIF